MAPWGICYSQHCLPLVLYSSFLSKEYYFKRFLHVTTKTPSLLCFSGGALQGNGRSLPQVKMFILENKVGVVFFSFALVRFYSWGEVKMLFIFNQVLHY